MSAFIGHNGGPTLAGGTSWRRHCWTAARAALLPTLPIEVVRTRVRRAAELGLDYKTYAGVRATTGHDLVAFLFSSNAIRLLREGDRIDDADSARLAAIRGAAQHLAVHPPLDPGGTRRALRDQGVPIDIALAAPGLVDGWPDTGRRIRDALATARHPSDRVLLIGETALERDWVAAARLAGFVPADSYFARPMAAHAI